MWVAGEWFKVRALIVGTFTGIVAFVDLIVGDSSFMCLEMEGW